MAGSLRKALAAAAGVAALCASAAGCGSPASHASSPKAAAPGILTGSVTIGSFQPLTGAGSAGAGQSTAAAAAYFAWVNAHGGVDGRRIIYRYLDDRGRAALAPSLAHRLVQQDNVLAIFNPAGDSAHQAVTGFLNAARVPDVFAASGCPCWDDPAALPETFGWQLDYIREGKILGAYLARRYHGAKIGVVYSAGPAGRDGAEGFSYEIPHARIAAREIAPGAATSLARQAAALKASNASVVAAFTSPAATAALLAAMKRLNYHPALAVDSAGADPTALVPLLAKALGSPAAAVAAISGIVTDSALPPSAGTSSWTVLFRKIHNRYVPELPFDQDVIGGMAAACAFTEALQHAGANPTRETLAAAITAGLPQGPALAPLGYSTASHAGQTGAAIAVVRGGALALITPAMTTTTAPGTPVIPAAPQPPAPPAGIPPQ